VAAPGESPRGPWRAFGAGFRFAWDGLAAAVRRQRNLRVQLACGVLASALAALGPFAPAERALLLASVAAVIALETLNTAVEAAVDLASAGLDERARLAKDAAAGAVLVASAGALLVLLALALPRPVQLARALAARPAGVAGALVAAAAAGLVPWRAGTSRARDAALALLGAAGIAAVALQAESQAGTVAAATCLAVAAGAAFRR
jgi:diacylglycerol kinase (ATP)